MNQSFFLLTISVLVWMAVSFFEDEAVAVLWHFPLLEADFAFGAFASFCLLLFCLDIIRWEPAKDRWFRGALLGIAAMIGVTVFSTDFIVAGYRIDSFNMISPVFGIGAYFYNILVVCASLSGLLAILWKFNDAEPAEKIKYAYLVSGLALSVSIVLVTNVLMTDYINGGPYYQFFSRLGIFGMVFVVLFPGYAMIRHSLFDVKFITAELLSFTILLVSFSQIFFSVDFFQVVVRFVIFIISAALVAFLIRAINNEIDRKEDLQLMADMLSSTNEQLHRLDNAKSEFISIASHQLRTPLTAIKGYLSLILEGSYGQVPPNIQDVLEKVYAVNNRLTQLVEDLLNISRIESGRIQYDFQPTQIETLAVELVDMFMLSAREKGIHLGIRLPKKSLPIIAVDQNKLREVISNLIDNAIKYTPEGSVTVEVGLSDDAAALRIIISDTGIGIEPETLGRLFKKFVRSQETSRMVVSGSGLGLYIGRNFVEAHGGKIWAESEGHGQGSRFIIELPFKRPDTDSRRVATFVDSYKLPHSEVGG